MKKDSVFGGCVKRVFFHRSFRSVVKNTMYVDTCCQGSARSADLHALDSNKTIHFIIGRMKKILFHRPHNKRSEWETLYNVRVMITGEHS